MSLIIFKNNVCTKCQKQMKVCWCSKDEIDIKADCRRRFKGYDLYCFECLEIDEYSLKKSIKEENDILIKKKYENELEETKKEIAIAEEFLSGKTIQFECVKCGHPYYNKPEKEVEFFCVVCDKYNYLIRDSQVKYKYYNYKYFDKDFNIKMLKCKMSSLSTMTSIACKKVWRKSNLNNNKNKINKL